MNDETGKTFSVVLPDPGSFPEDIICEVWGQERDDEANAHLIAAAPDLLDALGRALFHATLRGWATTEGHELAEVYEQMKAAIQKAKGRDT